MPVARLATAGAVDALAVSGLSVQTVLWSAVLTAAYARLHRTRA